MRDRSLALVAVGLVAAVSLSVAACADTVRPVLGALKIGAAAKGPLVMPMLENESLPFAYPRDAWIRGVGGETILRIHIATHGAVDSVAVAESSGDAVLDSAAVAGARLLKYTPAKQGQDLVPVWAYLPVRYPLPEAVTPDSGGSR